MSGKLPDGGGCSSRVVAMEEMDVTEEMA